MFALFDLYINITVTLLQRKRTRQVEQGRGEEVSLSTEGTEEEASYEGK